MKKSKHKRPPTRTTEPPSKAGANRRAVAVLTKKLADDIEKLDEQKRLLARQEARLLNQYKTDTGRSKRATKRALALYKMEDSTARDTEIGDQIEVMRDLGMARGEMPLFEQAGAEMALTADLVKETAKPGYIRSLGRAAFKDGDAFNSCPYDGTDDDAKRARAMWEEGWLAEQADQGRAAEPPIGDGAAADDSQPDARAGA